MPGDDYSGYQLKDLGARYEIVHNTSAGCCVRLRRANWDLNHFLLQLRCVLSLSGLSTHIFVQFLYPLRNTNPNHSHLPSLYCSVWDHAAFMQKPVDNVDNESLAFPVTFVGPCVDASADSQPFFRHLLELKSTEEHYMSFFPPFFVPVDCFSTWCDWNRIIE